MHISLLYVSKLKSAAHCHAHVFFLIVFQTEIKVAAAPQPRPNQVMTRPDLWTRGVGHFTGAGGINASSGEIGPHLPLAFALRWTR